MLNKTGDHDGARQVLARGLLAAGWAWLQERRTAAATDMMHARRLTSKSCFQWAGLRVLSSIVCAENDQRAASSAALCELIVGSCREKWCSRHNWSVMRFL
jgi:hypothetical protein